MITRCWLRSGKDSSNNVNTEGNIQKILGNRYGTKHGTIIQLFLSFQNPACSILSRHEIIDSRQLSIMKQNNVLENASCGSNEISWLEFTIIWLFVLFVNRKTTIMSCLDWSFLNQKATFKSNLKGGWKKVLSSWMN